MRIKASTGLVLCVALVLVGVSGARAVLVGTPGYSVSVASSGSGATYNIGFQFTPTSSMTVTALGYYDQAHDGLYDSHEVAIYYAQSYGAFNAGDLVPGAFTTVLPADSGGAPDDFSGLGGTLDIGTNPDGWYAYHALSAGVSLQQGVAYRIVANTIGVYWNGGGLHAADNWRYEPIGSHVNLAPMTTTLSVAASVAGTSSVSYPTGTDAGNLYSTPNFLFTLPAPEPSTIALLGLGGLLIVRRRSR